MKTAKEMPLFDGKRLMSLVHPVLEAQLLYTALEINLFAQLSKPKTAVEVAAALGCHQGILCCY